LANSVNITVVYLGWHQLPKFYLWWTVLLPIMLQIRLDISNIKQF